MVGNYQKAVAEIHIQAMELLTEMRSSQTSVLKSLSDADEAKHSFLLLKEEAEQLLAQLQGQIKKQPVDPKLSKLTGSDQPTSAYTTYSQTYPRVKPSFSTKNSTVSSDSKDFCCGDDAFKEEIYQASGMEASRYTVPIYAQVRKSHSDALRRKPANLSPENIKMHPRQFGNLGSPQHSPARKNRHVNTVNTGSADITKIRQPRR